MFTFISVAKVFEATSVLDVIKMSYIEFKNVILEYPVYDARATSLRNVLFDISTGGVLNKSARSGVNVRALDDVSFKINPGERIGLVGHNGAGKTTLLRTMAGIYPPVSGSVNVNGSMSTIIELGAGMEQELTGLENIIRMGLLAGISYDDIANKIPDIIDFTDLGDFINLPVRTYSAGMTMRLMFSVATSLQHDILIVDEMFATGDEAFQRKAQKRMESMIDQAEIFVFASHSPELISRFCNKIFHLNHGKIEIEEL